MYILYLNIITYISQTNIVFIYSTELKDKVSSTSIVIYTKKQCLIGGLETKKGKIFHKKGF